ncbi:hypothetical protein TUBRATIS_005540 [Tubulinosema ratisbonensis]|uniref:Uncharacterized protein n=1 Tax=Tubulinosema ratisbonensis TaxID=291195 RepID=A0A437AP19_9MICR|nr:hypothetical protein TUBRATIS_005540 [Tubulinosema ratisbonensis]
MQKDFFNDIKINYKPTKEKQITFTNSIDVEEFNTLESVCQKLGLPLIDKDPKNLLNFLKAFKSVCQKYSFNYNKIIDELIKNDKTIEEYNKLTKLSHKKEIELSYFFTILDFKEFNLKKLKNELMQLNKEKEIINKLNKNKNLLSGALIESKFVRNFVKEERIKEEIRNQQPSIIRDMFILIMDSHSITMSDLVKYLEVDRITALKIIFYFRDSGIILFDSANEIIKLNVK